MKYAVVLNDQQVITPIVEGTIVRIVNGEQFEDFENPALQLTEGRRGAVLRFVLAKDVKTFVAPPNTFCELSYNAALENDVQFIHIASGITFEQFTQDVKTVQTQLPAEEILPSV